MCAADLYFFDMDHTLINNDCDVSWKQFLVSEGIAPADDLKKADYFFEKYLKDELDPDEFMAFQLNEFKGLTMPEAEELTQRHFEKVVKEKIYPDARKAVSKAIESGKKVSMLTATNSVIAAPLARELGINEIVATELEMKNGRFTGKIEGIYCAAEGKKQKAEIYCRENGFSLENTAYFGDSLSDQYILAAVAFPFAVNPNPELRKIAEKNNWKILEFK